jgi:hypothetical protein
MDYHFTRHFTLDEASALLPKVRGMFEQIHALMSPPPADASRLQSHASGNGRKDGSAVIAGKDARVAAANAVLAQIADMGIVVQDWRRGLVDFPHIREGREVFLCYELADGNTIQHFHDLDAGYAGRRPL